MRLTLVLGSPRVGARVQHGHPLAAPHHLTSVYRAVLGLLAPGGLFLNADGLALNARQSGSGWWDALRCENALADLFAECDRVFPQASSSDDSTSPSSEFHEAALLEVGFTEVGTIWQDLDHRLLVAFK